LKGLSFADLTGGLGVDCWFISQNFEHTDYVEANPELCELARHNFAKVAPLRGAEISDVDTSYPQVALAPLADLAPRCASVCLGLSKSRVFDTPSASERRDLDNPTPAQRSVGLQATPPDPSASERRDFTIYNESAEDYLHHCGPLDGLFIDPARRDTYGRKTVSIADCTPNVVELQALMLQKARRVMIKLSPMLDISQALKELRHVKEIHVVAVENECKELLFILEPDFDGEPVFTCVNLQTEQPLVSFSLNDEKSSALSLAKEPARYLYEPNAAVMKGGCYRLLTQRYEVQKFHRNSHLYTSSELVPNFAGRIFEIDDWALYGKKANALLDGVDKASIAVRNFPMTVAELRKKLKIADGDQIYLFATTLSDERKVIIRAHKPQAALAIAR
jgi:hypothetical protein